MSLKMHELPEIQRPYEKLKMYGAEKLSNAELLAIIIKTGTKDENSIDIANRILLLSQNLQELKNIPIEELVKIKGIGEIKAILLKAVCELTTRITNSNNNIKQKVNSASDIANILMNEMMAKIQEVLKVIILNSKNEITKMLDVAVGTANVAHVTIKQILSEAIKMQAPKIILCHNHPSGDSSPSIADEKLTISVKTACDIFGIELLDHIVIGHNEYKSIYAKLAKEKTIN